jgi:hypothetical protein
MSRPLAVAGYFGSNDLALTTIVSWTCASPLAWVTCAVHHPLGLTRTTCAHGDGLEPSKVDDELRGRKEGGDTRRSERWRSIFEFVRLPLATPFQRIILLSGDDLTFFPALFKYQQGRSDPLGVPGTI